MTLFLGFGSLLVLWLGSRDVDPRAHHARRVRRVQRLPGDARLADDRVRLGHQHPAARAGVVEADARGASTPCRRSATPRVTAAGRAAALDGGDRDPRPDVRVSGHRPVRRSKDVSLRIEPGQTVAFVGATGSGKSTLISLLPRLHEPPPGTVLIGGIDIREIPLARLRGAIGFVPQEPFLFSDTIAENIAFGAETAKPRSGTGLGPRGRCVRAAARRAARQGRRGVSARLRDDGGRARHHAVGRPEAAHRASPARVMVDPAHPDPGRRAVGGGHLHRGGDPVAAARRDARSGRRSSCRTASRPCATPIRSSCCTTAGSPSAARTTSSSPGTGSTPRCIGSSYWKRNCKAS